MLVVSVVAVAYHDRHSVSHRIEQNLFSQMFAKYEANTKD
jgi:hypothetical protein